MVFTTNDSAYAPAFDLDDAGVQIELVVDVRAQVPDVLRRECDRRGIPVRAGAVVTGTRGDDRITEALVADFDGVNVGASEAVSCDTLLVSGGWNPAVHLFSQARGTLRYDSALGGFVPGEHLAGAGVAGAANGVMDLTGCLREGRDAAAAGLAELGIAPAESALLPEVAAAEAAPGLVLWRVPADASRISSSMCSATPPSPTWRVRSARACARWSTSSATPPSAPRTIRARRPG